MFFSDSLVPSPVAEESIGFVEQDGIPATAKAAEDARKNQYKIPVWRDGRIEFEIPGIITEQLHSRDGNKCGGADA